MDDLRREKFYDDMATAMRLPRGCDEHKLVLAARRQGVRVEGAAWHWAHPQDAPPALVIGYGPVSEAEAKRGTAALGAAYASLATAGS